MGMSPARFGSQGFGVLPSILDDVTCDAVAAQIDRLPETGAGSRQLLHHDWCRQLAFLVRTHPAILAQLLSGSVGVQCTLFNKSPNSNWLVAFHQDRSVPVRDKVDSPELAGWSEKEGGIFVQPPVSLLQQMTAVRIHIDACPVESGALRVVSGSHLSGVLSPPEVERIRRKTGEESVPVRRGGALLMKPLLLHASSKAASPIRRRVLHFVFGPSMPPLGLAWQYAI